MIRRLLAVCLVLWPAVAQARSLSDIMSDARRRASSFDAAGVKTLADEAAADAPHSAIAVFLRARADFLAGDYDAADKSCESEELADKVTDPETEMGDLCARIHRTARLARSMVEAKTPDGDVSIRYLPGKDAVLVPYALDALVAIRREIGNDFAWHPKHREPLRVEFYPSAEALAQVVPLTVKEIETSGTIAICQYDKLMLTTPRALVYGYSWIDTLAHEYVHYVVIKKTDNAVPVWLHEGLARWHQARWRLSGAEPLSAAEQSLLASALAKDDLVPFEKMAPSMAKLKSQREVALAFSEVYTAVDWLLAERGGRKKLVALLDDIRSTRDAWGSIANVYGTSIDAFTRDWKKFLGRMKLERRATTDVGLKLKGRSAKQAGLAAAEESEVGSEKARVYVRLATLLASRSHPKAAAIELEKASQLTSARDPIVEDRRGQMLILAGKSKAAAAVLEVAAKLHPHHAPLIVHLARALLLSGQNEKARQRFEQAIALNPYDPEIHIGLAKIYAAAGNAGKAAREKDILKILNSSESKVGELAQDRTDHFGTLVCKLKGTGDAEVTIDGRYLGHTPYEGPVPSGKHQFLVKLGDGRSVKAELEIEDGAKRQWTPDPDAMP